MHDREGCLKPFMKSLSVAGNNNTRLASGVSRRKHKLEGVVQKRIARIIAITYGLSSRKTFYAALLSRKVLVHISCISDQSYDTFPAPSHRPTLRQQPPFDSLLRPVCCKSAVHFVRLTADLPNPPFPVADHPCSCSYSPW